jgi:glutamate dehydrogenase
MTVLMAVCDEIRHRVRPAEADLIVRFTELFLAKASAEFFQDRTPETLAALALSAFRHLQRSRPVRVHVDIMDPEQEPEPWTAPVTVIRTTVSERPFVVGSIREFLHSRQVLVERFLHPVLQVVRDGAGDVLDVGPATPGTTLESIVHCEVARIADRAVLREIRDGVRHCLEDVFVVTTDFGPMVSALNETVAALEGAARRLPDRRPEIEEVQEFLRWLRYNFTFLGYHAWGVVDGPVGRALLSETGSGLGLLRQERRSAGAEPIVPDAPPVADVETVTPPGQPRWPPRVLAVSQTKVESTVHRRVRMQCITVRTVDNERHILGERRFIGLFRSRAYAEEAERIPIVRHKLRTIVAQAGWLEGSHNFRESVKIFNSMPREELFLASAVELRRQIEAILSQYYTPDVKATVRPDPVSHAVSIMVIMPKERYSGRARRAIQTELVKQFDGTLLNYNLVMGGGEQARLHFQIAAPAERLTAVAPEQIEEMVHDLIQSWTDALELRLAESRPADEARRLASRWGAAFSPEYQAATSPEDAIADVTAIEAMEAGSVTVDLRLSNPQRASADAAVTRLRVYLRGERLVLSDFMPILENAGLRVLSMSPFEATDAQGGARIYAFAVQDAEQRPLDLERRASLLAETILAVRAGDTANDSLNELVLAAGLAWREVDVLRAYCEYAFQLGLMPARSVLPAALRAYARAAWLLVRIFQLKFEPVAGLTLAARTERIAATRDEFIRSLEQVDSLADDRVLRRLLALLDATVRTNYFLHGGAQPTARSGGVPYISFKILSELLQPLVPSRLRAEVWVQSARMAGIHMRGGKVSRGGIRHSDRPNDLRTEVAGLVRTQSVKNAVIVPAGAKGGFVIRRQPADAKELAAEVEAQYRTLISGLLDITDNLIGNELARPADLVVHDDADPYLVVAADKGTASFSDLANAVAADYRFWMDDAFASGGSNGYDHKRVGITARGAWECVRRHFHEMGRDTQSEPFTVVGIGDMSGDVFGNGMLLSRQIRLLAAFDHRHIFVDPNPDPEATFAERQRLFRLSRSSWSDYDRTLLSAGGFIVPRGIKEIELRAEARAALGVPEGGERMDGETLIRTILRAPVDLLWNGGIGTYVKAPQELHANAGDPANDAVRIDASELRCRVIGEGGNLGLTQRARVRFALDGGRCYTDAIDNSGGVEMSDREVNLKILLNAVVSDGRLDRDRRNALLHELTGAVTDRVLHDNRSQSLAISLDVLRAKERVEDFHDLMVALERNRVIDRNREALPTLEVLVERRALGQSLTKPELAVLLAHTKLTLKQTLLASGLVDEPAMERYLADYFPDRAVHVAGPAALARHRLRREIVATQLTNDMLDLMGVSFLHRMTRDSAHSETAVARAWFIAASLAGAAELRQRLTPLVDDGVATDVVYRWQLGLARVLERTTRWILASVPDDAPIDAVIGEYLDGLRMLRGDFRAVVTGPERELFETLVGEACELTHSEDLAASLITLRFLDQLLEILRVARDTHRSPVRAGHAYYLASDLLSLPALRQTIFDTAGDGRWDQRAAQALAEDVGRAHRRLTAAVLMAGGPDAPVEELLANLAAERARELQAYRQRLADMATDERASLAALIIVVRQLAALGAADVHE